MLEEAGGMSVEPQELFMLTPTCSVSVSPVTTAAASISVTSTNIIKAAGTI